MSQKIQTPYGTFDSISIAARYISHYYGPQFMYDNPGFHYPYDKKLDDKNKKGPNNSNIHYIYKVIQSELAPKTGKSTPGWIRI